MLPVEISLSRINAALEEVRRLSRNDFPYEDSRDALSAITEMLEKGRNRFDKLSLQDTDATAQQVCRESLDYFFYYLEFAGFILRSTDLRNNFEVYGVLKRLFRKALNRNNVKLILSSEWTYSPMIYREVEDLKGFVFVGFPTTEANNPLLLPLAGHELGHAFWKEQSVDAAWKSQVVVAIQKRIKEEMPKLKALYPDWDELDFWTNIGSYAQDAASAKMEEYFCDFMGLKMFGESFLCSFGYLLGPGVNSASIYPTFDDRIAALIEAAEFFGYEVPPCFRLAFENAPSISPVYDREELIWADDIARGFRTALMKFAGEQVVKAGIPLRSLTEVKRVEASFNLRIPTSAASLADILNAAWRHALKLWDEARVESAKDRSLIKVPQAITELTLKSIEIMEIEAVLSENATEV